MITAVVLGGVDINGGRGSMIGAVLSLLLIGLMRFGMGLVNIQGQVQGIAIGLLLILSILLPGLARNLRGLNGNVNRRVLLRIAVSVLVFILFFVFFYWSRAPVISAG
ncbi:MAG: hypothetical protein ACREUU_00690 [Gammaproteobacteria bacterium]